MTEIASDDEFDEEDFDWVDALCSMGRDGQCGQAGSEHCDFECPNMRAWREEQRRKLTKK